MKKSNRNRFKLQRNLLLIFFCSVIVNSIKIELNTNKEPRPVKA